MERKEKSEKTKINVSKSEVPRLVKDGFVIEANQRRKDFKKMHDYIFSRFLSTDTERGDDHPDILFGGKDSILPPKREEEKKK